MKSTFFFLTFKYALNTGVNIFLLCEETQRSNNVFLFLANISKARIYLVMNTKCTTRR